MHATQLSAFVLHTYQTCGAPPNIATAEVIEPFILGPCHKILYYNERYFQIKKDKKGACFFFFFQLTKTDCKHIQLITVEEYENKDDINR
jgi:hypothetical protein